VIAVAAEGCLLAAADYGNRYQSKLFNPAFLRSKNLPVPDWFA
jgi:hypothetical protein